MLSSTNILTRLLGLAFSAFAKAVLRRTICPTDRETNQQSLSDFAAHISIVMLQRRVKSRDLSLEVRDSPRYRGKAIRFQE
jgi:hypothetical protein